MYCIAITSPQGFRSELNMDRWDGLLAALYLGVAKAADACGYTSQERANCYADLPSPAETPGDLDYSIAGDGLPYFFQVRVTQGFAPAFPPLKAVAP